MVRQTFPSNGPPWERKWGKMISISIGLHLLVLAFFFGFFSMRITKIKVEPAYFVDLVSSLGESPGNKKINGPLAASPSPSPPRVEAKPIALPKPVKKKIPEPKAESTGKKKIKEDLAIPSTPSPRIEAKPITPSKPAEKKIPEPKVNSAKELEQAMEELKNKVQREKALENKFNNLEKKVQDDKSLEKTFSRLEKKVREEQSGERALARAVTKRQLPSPVRPGPGGGGAGSISSPVAEGKEVLGISFQLYLGALRNQIKKNWGLPEELLKKNDISAEILIRIDRNGHIEDFRFKRKSGIEVFDQEVLRTLKKSDPLPPLPEGYPKNSYEVVLTFHSTELP